MTVAKNSQLEPLPQRSSARQVTNVVPMGNVLPDGGTQVTVGDGSVSSVTVGAKVTTAPAALVAGTVMFAGHVIVGGVESPPTSGNVVATLRLSMYSSPMLPRLWLKAIAFGV